MPLPPRPSQMAAAAAAAASKSSSSPARSSSASPAPAAAPPFPAVDPSAPLPLLAAPTSLTASSYIQVHPSTLRAHSLRTHDPVLLLLLQPGASAPPRPVLGHIWPSPGLAQEGVALPDGSARAAETRACMWSLDALRSEAGVTETQQRRKELQLELLPQQGADAGAADEELCELLAVRARESLVEQGDVLPGQLLQVSLLDETYLLRVTGMLPASPSSLASAPSKALRSHALDVARCVIAIDRGTQFQVKLGSRSKESYQSKADAGKVASAADAEAYQTLGGLGGAIKELKSLVELPLRRPEVFTAYGLRPPRGVLLYGPPGTGKTTLASACARSCGVASSSIFHLSGPSLSSSLHGRTEARLRALFAKAQKHAPAVIIIDEIDALAPRREAGAGSEGAGEVERRVVATLLTLMDGLGEVEAGPRRGAGEDESEPPLPGRVVVIAATNRPNALDPALRRPGRLDREIEIGIPTAPARLEILQVLLRSVPHSMQDDELEMLATGTHGFVGADLASLVREAGMAALARNVRSADGLASSFSGLSLSSAPAESRISAADFAQARTRVRPSAMRELFQELPKVRWSDIASGGAETLARVRECVEWPLKHAPALKRLGVRPPTGVLLYGPPGCSKTLIARAIASESGLNFVAVKGPELYNKFVGESERALRDVFTRARAASPAIIFFDEIDALTSTRSGSGGSVSDGVIATLLNEMDGVETLDSVLVVAATNRPEIIDPALLRPGRLDRLLYVGPPDTLARRQILTLRTRDMALGSDVDLDAIADMTQGCSGAEVVSVCQDAGMRALNESLDATHVSHAHLLAAARAVRRRITPGMLMAFTAWRDQTI